MIMHPTQAQIQQTRREFLATSASGLGNAKSAIPFHLDDGITNLVQSIGNLMPICIIATCYLWTTFNKMAR